MYTVDNPPDWLKNLPKGAIKLAIAAFNAALEKKDDEDAARKAAWAAVKTKYEKGERGQWRATQDVSLDDIRDMLWKAVSERDKDSYLREVFGSYLIFEKEGKYFKLPWSILDGAAQLGSEAVEVEQAWLEARSAQAAAGEETDENPEFEVRLGQAGDPEGRVWDVTICEPGFTKNGWHHPEEVLRVSADMFEGVSVDLYDDPQGFATHFRGAAFDIKAKLTGHKAGWIDNANFVSGQGINGTLHFLDSHKYLGKNILVAMEDGVVPYGLSYDASVRAKRTVVDGRQVMQLVKFNEIDSVDIVSRPAAGGKFHRALMAQKEEIMNKQELWDLVSKQRPDLVKDKVFEAMSEDEVKTLARMAMEPAAKEPGGGGGNDEPAADDPVALLRCEMALDRKLEKSDLPELAQKRIRAVFSKRVFEDAELDTAVGEEKDYLAKMAQPAGGGDPVPGSGINVGIGTLERAQMAVDRMFGLAGDDVLAMARMETLDHQPFFLERMGAAGFSVRSAQDLAEYDQVPAFRSIREMYTFLTGDPEVTGFFNRKKLPADLRASMDITSATFTYVLGNTLGRRLVKEYRGAGFREELLVSVKKPVRDFRQQEAVLVGGFADLSDVDPESADYEEIAAITDEEVTYTIAQKGNILSFSRKLIINDDITIVQRAIAKVGRSARRTHGKYVWNKYINNSTCTDGTAVFTSGHGNLGATALSHTTALVGWQALAAMTEKDSGEYLGLLDGSDVVVNLVGPPALKALIGRIEKEEFYYSSNDLTTKLPNSLFGEVKGHTLSLLAGDANDWYMTLPPNVVELIEMGYLNGREEPEMFVADSPQSEQVFVADKIRHKIRHEYAGAPIDYRGSYKAVVT